MDYSKLGLYCSVGDKGNGKSLDQAKMILDSFKEYDKNARKYPDLPRRMALINQPLSAEMEQQHLNRDFIYWQNVHRLRHCFRPNCFILDPTSPFYIMDPKSVYFDRNFNPERPEHAVHDSDIFWDEIGRDFPAGSWNDTPKWVKAIFSHCRKRGNRVFANTQVFDDTDIAFRRQCDFILPLRKVVGSRDISATRPPVRWVWGLCIKNMWRREDFLAVAPQEYIDKDDEERREEVRRSRVNFFPSILWIRRRYVNIYNTRAELPPYMADKLDEQVLVCVKGKYCAKKDRHGKPHMVVRHLAI